MKRYAVAFTAKERAELIEEEIPQLKPDEVLVKTDYDLISAGTELANYHELPNTGTTGGKFPMIVGYSTSGRVLEIGSAIDDLKPGDRVICCWGGHRSHQVSARRRVRKIPDGVEQVEACFAHLASFPMLGVRKLELQLGEGAMVAGLGLLGLFAVQFAKLSGACPVLACDFSPERRELAKKLGADAVFDPREPDFGAKVKAMTDGRGPDGVVEVTGCISALQQALEYVAWEGRISLLGCTRISDKTIDFYRYVHRRGVRLIGAHTNTRPLNESKPGEWTEQDDYRTFFRLLQAGRLQVKPLMSRLVSPRDCGAVYREIGFAEKPVYGNVFDWTDF